MTRRFPDWIELVVTMALFLVCYDLIAVLAIRSMKVLAGDVSKITLVFGLLVMLGGGALLAHILIAQTSPARREELYRILDNPWDRLWGFLGLSVLCMIPTSMSLSVVAYLLSFIR